MLFNSLQFAAFFVIVTFLFFLLPHRWRAPMLLAASCYFYMAFVPVYILILAFTIGIDYAAGLLISAASGRRRKLWLIVSIVANISVLAWFKYADFINDTLRQLALGVGMGYSVPALDILLPIGLSFHTFQSMSYTIEVYRDRQPVERSLLRFALYVMFYPQLVAGPIERPQNLLPQFSFEHRFDYDRVRSGLQLMAWGLFKKVAVADRVADAVNLIYDDSAAFSGVAILLATYLFAIQIYCDFSGYSDIAIGAARVMGFRLMRNFDRPYFSQSVAEFWRRWHISLSTWFRDYVYLPLGGNRVTLQRRMLNLMIVFSLSGLWHGARWTFVIWGMLNGLYLAVGVLLSARRPSEAGGMMRVPFLGSALKWAVTFHLILLSWVFFRATSLEQAFDMLVAIVSFRPGQELPFDMIGGRTRVLVSIGALVACEILQSRGALQARIVRMPVVARWALYSASLLALLILGNFASRQQFIYFQF